MEQPRRAAFVGAIIAALITLPGLGAGTLWDNSETAYAEVAREILLTHDWVVMHLNGAPWFVQPPLYFWIAAGFAHAIGVTSLAFRLPAALATICMGAMTGYAVARQAGTQVGVYASAILSSCLMQAVIGRLAIMDALLDLAIALAIFWWFRALEAGRDRYFIYGWIAVAFGSLAKGPVAPAVALLVFAAFAFWNGRSERMRLPSMRAWLGGCAIAFAIVAPWLAAIGVRSGFHALVELIGHYTVGRYTGVIENQAGPVWYYAPVVIIGFFPWIAFLPVSLAYGIRQLKTPTTSPKLARLWRLAFVWAIVPLVFFSFAKTKLPNYIALEFPALALMVALYFDGVVKLGRNLASILSAATVPVFIGIIAIAIAVFVRDNRITSDALSVAPDLLVMGATIFVGSLLTALLLASWNTRSFAPYALATATALAMDILAVVALPHAEAFKPIPHLAAAIDALRQPGDAVAIQDFRGFNALVFYTKPPVAMLSAPDALPSADVSDARAFVCSHDRIWLVGAEHRPGYDPTYGRTRVLVTSSDSAALYLYKGDRCSPEK